MDLLNERLNRGQAGTMTTSDDARPLFRGELRALSASLASAIPRSADRATRVHLEDLRDQVARALDPKFAQPAMTGPSGMPRGFDFLDLSIEPATCWPDYRIPGPNPKD